MTTVAIQSIQQNSVDKFKVKLRVYYEVRRIQKLEFTVFDKDGVDVTSKLKSIKASNSWTDEKDEIADFEIYLNTNSYLEAGTYIFAFYEKDVNTSEPIMIFNYPVDIKYMEDIRTNLANVVPIAIDKIKLVFNPISTENPSYQSKNLLNMMNISLYDESSTNYNDVFEPLSSVIDNYGDEITELVLTLKDGRVLPEGNYNIMITTRFGSRTLSVIENKFNIPFLTTTPPHIGSVTITRNSNDTNLNIVFDTFLEKTMLDTARFSVIDEDGDDVTDKFEALRISPEYNSTSGITYLTQINIPLYSGYTLEKCTYFISFTWDNYDIYESLNYEYNSKKWYLYDMSTILTNLDYVTFVLPKQIFTDDLSNMGYIIEKYNTSSDEYISDDSLKEAFGPLYIPDTSDDNEWVNGLRVDIVDKTKLKQDNIYSFIIYHDKDGERVYDYIGHIDIIGEVTPTIKSISQKDESTVTVKLEKRLPIEVINYCIPKLLPYGGSEYIDGLMSIKDSNEWDSDLTQADTFDVVIDENVKLNSGHYTFNLLFGNKMLDKPVSLFLQYMEKRKGIIESIEQISLSTIRVKFSEPQSRSFLLASELRVVKKNNQNQTTAVDYSDKFEPIENVLKDNQFTFDELEIPMDNEDYIPSGKYTISLSYLVTDAENNVNIVNVYSYDVTLGFMTNNIPEISTIDSSMDENGLTTLKVTFANYLVKELLTNAMITLTDSNGRDILWKFEDKDNWTLYTLKDDPINFIGSMTLKILSKNIKIEKGKYEFKLSWKGIIKYLDDISKNVSLNYVLPEIEEQEVTSYNSAENTARLYFKFKNVLQYQFFEDLQVLALDSKDQDHTEYFSTIQEANPFDGTTMSTDNINLDVVEPLSITYGIYKFIFYHVNPILMSISITLPQSIDPIELMNYSYKVIDDNGYDITYKFKSISFGLDDTDSSIETFGLYVKDSETIYITDTSSFTVHLYNGNGDEINIDTISNIIDIKESEYISKLDIRAALSPQIVSVEQIGIDVVRFYLKSSIPIAILEGYNFSFLGFSHNDYTSYFNTITQSNTWDHTEDRFTDYFDLELKGGCIINDGGYSFRIYAGTKAEVAAGTALELDEISFTLQYMEGTECEIKAITIENLSTLKIEFDEYQKVALFKTLRFSITTYDGVDITKNFESFDQILNKADYDEFKSINISLNDNCELAKGIYIFSFIRPGDVEDIVLSSTIQDLTYMSKTYPLLYEVSATKTDSGADGLVMWFSPPLELDLFEHSILSMENTSGMSIKDKFVSVSDAILQIDEKDGIEYVDFATLELKPNETLDRDKYVIKYTWIDDYKYVNELTRETSLDYILIPLESVEMKNTSTLELKFKSDVSSSFLLNSELVVDSTYKSKNDDGVVITDVNFTDKFKPIMDTNDFTSSKSFRKVIVQLNKDEQLPVATYRFIIAEKITEENIFRLRYAYAGKIDIELMIGDDVVTNVDCDISQYSLDTLKLAFKDPIDVSILDKSYLKLTGVSSYIEKDNFSGYFLSIKESNRFSPTDADVVNISDQIKDINLRNQYDLSYAGLLTFDDVYVFHREALLAAGITEDAVISIIMSDKDYTPKEYRDKCVECEMDYMLHDFVVTVTKDDAYLSEQSTDNYYNYDSKYYKDPDGTYYYEHAEKHDTIVNDIHYISYVTDVIYLKLQNGKAIPEGVYELALMFENHELVKQQISTTFMTTTPPEITSMSITDDHKLQVNFSPYAEETSTLDSQYDIMIYSGLDAEGKPIGTNVSSNFGSILNATFEKIEQRGITYLSRVMLPINSDAFLPSGRYKLDWLWNERSFLNNLSYIGALNVIAKGIKSATLLDNKTIKIILEDKVLASNIKSLELTVENSMGEDCSELFSDLSVSNKDINDTTTTDTYYITVEDGEDVITDTYKFTLTLDMPEDDTDDEIIPSPAYEFAMNIVFMTTEFPSIEKIDNLSTQTYIVQTLTNDNIDEYLGSYIQPLTSDNRELLTKENYNQYLSLPVKIYDTPSIDSLYMVFTEEVYPCLLNACTATVINSDGLNVSDRFKSIYYSNNFAGRRVVDRINIILENAYEDEYLEKLEVTIYQADGEDITDKFQNIIDSNSFEDGIKIRSFNLLIEDDENIEDYEASGLQIVIINNEGEQITNFKSTVITKSIDTVTTAKLTLERGYTLPPDQYTVTLSYQNEPGLEGAVSINAFTYSGKLPFLSTNLGNILEVVSEDLSKLYIEFTEDLPISLFMDMETKIYNEDNEDCTDNFKDLQESNNFDGISLLSQLEIPMTIVLDLKVGKTLSSGKYTFQFTTNISSGEDDDGEEEMGDDEKAPNNEIYDVFTLWTYGTALPYMVKASDNTIVEVKQTAIDELKVTLDSPIDLNLLKAFSVAVTNQSNGRYYDTDTFKALNVSNRFGYSVLLSDNKYIMYSEDNVSWNRLDTGLSVAFNDMVYDEKSNNLIVTCSNGKILTISEFTKSGCTVHDTGLTKGLNSIIKVENKFIGVGLDGAIITGYYSINEFTWNIVSSPTKNTLTQVIAVSDTELFAVGYKGTLLHSTDCGNTWEIIATISSANFNGIVKYKYIPEKEEPEVEDDTTTNEDLVDEEDVGEAGEVDDTDTDDDDNSKFRNGLYIVGSEGTILYTSDGKGQWEIVESGVKKTLFGITSYNNKLIVVGDTGTILISPDTITFNKVETDATFTLRNITQCDERLIACGSNGKWLTSSSGNQWTVNSTIYSNGLRNVGCIPSQYEDNRNIDYFYLKLNYGYEIGNVSFYDGTEIPTLDNSPANTWKSDAIKNNHVGDVYNVYKTVGGITTHETSYQFILEKTYDEETKMVISSEYKWKEVGNEISPSTGEYTFYIVNTEANYNVDDESVDSINGRKIYYEKSGIELTYLTNEPGKIVSATLMNPDTKTEPTYQTPFIHVEIENCNEIAIHYASYEIIDEDGKDCSGYFLPIKQGFLDYSSSYAVNGINLIGNAETIWDIPHGNYTLVWSWCRYDENTIRIPLSIPKIRKFIKTVTPSTPVLNAFQFDLIHYPRLEYFTERNDNGMLNLQTNIYKIDTTNGTNSLYDYSTNFLQVFESTDFNDPQYKNPDNKIPKFNLQLNSGVRLPKGKYLLKFRNDATSIADGNDTMVVTTTIIDVDFELTDQLPSISNVELKLYSNIVEGIVNDNTNKSAPLIEYFSGTVHPVYTTYYSNWKAMGASNEWDSELKKHVGDIYTNTYTDKKYSFVYDSYIGDYRWELNVETPHLVITFGNKPSLDGVLRFTNNIEFNEYDASNTLLFNLNRYLLQDINEWDFDITNVSGETLVTKIKIPLDETMSYPGVSNATFSYYWKDSCIYDDLEYKGISTPSAIREYGEIAYASPIVIPGLTAGESADYGIVIKFEYLQFTDFLSKMDWSMTHKTYDSEGAIIDEDVSGYFHNVSYSNPEFSGMRKTDMMYLFLLPGQAIDAGTYTLELTCYKTANDIYSQGTEPEMQEQYDAAESGELTFETVYKFHDEVIYTKLKEKGETDEAAISVKIQEYQNNKYAIPEADRDSYVEAEIEYMMDNTLPEDDGIVRFVYQVELPWITSTPPSSFDAVFLPEKEGFNYPVLNIKFDVSPPITEVNQFSINVRKGSETIDYTDCFRTYASSLIKYNPVIEDGVVTQYVESIDIPMKRCRGMKKGTYDVTFAFNPNSILMPLPSKKPYESFETDRDIITKMGKIVNMTTKGRAKMIVEFQPDAEVDGANIATSQVGRVYGWASWNDAINNTLTMSAKNGSGTEKIKMFKGPKLSGNKMTFTLKDNCKVNPCKLKLGLTFNDYYVISSKKIAFKGLIVNLQASKKDKLCYILVTKHDGSTRKHVYSTYEKAQKRIKKMKKLNEEEKAQLALCKQCRKIKFLSTSKVKAQLEKYIFPTGKRLKFFKKAANKFYKYQAKLIGCTEVDIQDDTNDNENDEGRLKCANYIKKTTPYTWTLKIATMATAYPKSGKVIYFAYHVKNGVQLERGYKANKKNNKTKKFKKYINKLTKYIKKYKKKAAKCKKCKKRVIATKGSTKIGWSAALFPIYFISKNKKNKPIATNIVKVLTKYFKKKKVGCAKANFKFVKKNTQYSKLTCKKYKKSDKTLKYGSFKTYFKK